MPVQYGSPRTLAPIISSQKRDLKRGKNSMHWFRLYAEFATDPKVQMLSEIDQRRYIMLLCLKCNGDYDHRDVTVMSRVTFALRVTAESWNVTKAALRHAQLLNEDGSIHGWEKRQYISDIKDPTAAERQRRHRDKNRDSRDNTVTSRAPEQNRTELDTEQSREEEKKDSLLSDRKKIKTFSFEGSEYLPEDLFELLWQNYPDNKPVGNKSKAKEKFIKLINQGENHEAIINGTRTYSEFCKSTEQYNQHCITWLNQRGWEGEWKSGKRNVPQTSRMDKTKAAAQKALDLLNIELEANRDAPWNQRDTLGSSTGGTSLSTRNHESLPGRTHRDNDASGNIIESDIDNWFR